MPIDPDDILGPDDELPKGRVIDVTPKPEKEEKQGIDFDTDKPIIEQILENHKLDRSDKTEKQGCLGTTAMLIGIVIVLAYLLISFLR
jgi:hypothetical protein